MIYNATDSLRERLNRDDTNIGHDLKSLKEIFNKDYIDFNFITKHRWWSYFDDSDERFEKEKDEEFESRIFLFTLWFIFRDEKNVCVVTHSKVYNIFNNSIFNKSKNACGYIIGSDKIIAFLRKILI